MLKLVPFFLSCKKAFKLQTWHKCEICADLMALLTRELTWFQVSLSVCINNWIIMEEYGIMEYLGLTVTAGGEWETENLFGVALMSLVYCWKDTIVLLYFG